MAYIILVKIACILVKEGNTKLMNRKQLSKKKNCKKCYIGDLGLAILVSEVGSIIDIQEVMPELLSSYGLYSQTTDIYIFGIII